MIGQHREKIVFALLVLGAVASLTAVLSPAREGPQAPASKQLRVTVTLPDAVAGEPLFVGSTFSEYFPGETPESRTIFGRPLKKASVFKRVRLAIPAGRRPRAPAAATSPGPALMHSEGLPRAGAGAEEWKKP